MEEECLYLDQYGVIYELEPANGDQITCEDVVDKDCPKADWECVALFGTC